MTHQFDSGPGPEGGPGALFDDGVAVVVGAVVETLPGRAPSVACRLENMPDLDVVGGDGNRRLAIVWCSGSAKGLERAMEQLVKDDEEILGIFPTFMGQDDPTGETEARAGAMQQLIDDE
jgi:nitrate reductase NapAB chaperone NapD